jgi:transposase
LYRYPAGIARRNLPERFDDFRVIRTRSSRWSRSGVWEQVFKVLSQDADNEYTIIVRAHQRSACVEKRSGTPSAAVEVD